MDSFTPILFAKNLFINIRIRLVKNHIIIMFILQQVKGVVYLPQVNLTWHGHIRCHHGNLSCYIHSNKFMIRWRTLISDWYWDASVGLRLLDTSVLGQQTDVKVGVAFTGSYWLCYFRYFSKFNIAACEYCDELNYHTSIPFSRVTLETLFPRYIVGGINWPFL